MRSVCQILQNEISTALGKLLAKPPSVVCHGVWPILLTLIVMIVTKGPTEPRSASLNDLGSDV